MIIWQWPSLETEIDFFLYDFKQSYSPVVVIDCILTDFV